MPRVEVKLPGKGPAIAIIIAAWITLLLYSIQNICAIRSFSKYFCSVLSVFHNAKGSPGKTEDPVGGIGLYFLNRY